MIQSIGQRFTIQVYSKTSPKEAEDQMNRLIRLGLDAYIQKAYFEDKNELWYRVRVGTYNSKEEAKKAAAQVNRRSGVATWVDKVRIDQ